MIVTDHFVFVHLHKAGGSFIKQFLLRFFPESWFVGYHYPHTMIPETHRHLPRLGTVRNPWDFYVSYFHFQDGLLRRANERNGAMSADEMKAFVAKGNDPLNGIDLLFQVLTDDGAGGFVEGTRAMTPLDRNPERFERLVESLPVGMNRRGYDTPIQLDGYRGMNVLQEDLATARGTGEGLETFLFRHMYGEDPDMHFIKMERLRDELLDYLRDVGVEVTAEMEDYVLSSARVNTSKHEHYSSYYTDDLQQVVAKADAGLIDRFGYTFESK